MPEETKDEYIARHRRELGINEPEVESEAPVKKPTLKERLNTVLFILGLTAFTWILLQIFGMMKSN